MSKKPIKEVNKPEVKKPEPKKEEPGESREVKAAIAEIREKFGIGVITCFIRIEGRPMGVIANNPHHLAGAIDSDGADKGARFLQLCDAFDARVRALNSSISRSV